MLLPAASSTILPNYLGAPMSDLVKHWDNALSELPLIAILRGIQTCEAEAIVDALVDAGFQIVEVPLNSPTPLATLELLAKRFGEQIIIGAGTVLTSAHAQQAVDAGCKVIIAPNINPGVAETSKQNQVIYCPGVATPTEAFTAIESGAHALKLFPAEMITPVIVKAIRAIIPSNIKLIPVGGIEPDTMKPYIDAGAGGFGIGSALYAPGKTRVSVQKSATAFIDTFRQIRRH